MWNITAIMHGRITLKFSPAEAIICMRIISTYIQCSLFLGSMGGNDHSSSVDLSAYKMAGDE